MTRIVGLLLALLLALCCRPGLANDDELLRFALPASAPPGYPADYAAVVRAAEDERELVIYATTDAALVAPLIEDFRSMYPRIDVRYEDLNSTELHYRFVAENDLGRPSADIVWSSAMDQQTALADRGYALGYESPEALKLPEWARWRDQLYGTTFEPVAIIYNKNALAASEVPHTRAALAALLLREPERFAGKVMSYDIEKSGVGFLLASQDADADPAFWDLAQALGKARLRFALTTDAMVRRVARGDALLAYNVLGAYALNQAARDPTLGVVLPSDYTLVLSRLMFINKKATHPNAARLWLDYLLSQRGQSLLAGRSHLYAVRSDVGGDHTAAALRQRLGQSLRPIPIGAGLTRHASGEAYRDFVQRWRGSLGGGAPR